MSAIHEALKRAQKMKEPARLSPAIETIELPERMESRAFLKPQGKPFPFVPVILAIALAAVFFMFLAERDIRVQTQTELSQRLIELSDKQSRITQLVQQNIDLEQTLTSRISELEFTLKELNDSFDILMMQKKSLQAEKASQRKEIARLNTKIHQIEREKEALQNSLYEASNHPADLPSNLPVTFGDTTPS